MRQRTPISTLKLQGESSNLARAIRREQRESLPMSDEQAEELQAVTDLIGQVIRACRKGSTLNGKKNPAYGHLVALVRVRRELLRVRPGEAGKKSTASLLRSVDALLAPTQPKGEPAA